MLLLVWTDLCGLVLLIIVLSRSMCQGLYSWNPTHRKKHRVWLESGFTPTQPNGSQMNLPQTSRPCTQTRHTCPTSGSRYCLQNPFNLLWNWRQTYPQIDQDGAEHPSTLADQSYGCYLFISLLLAITRGCQAMPLWEDSLVKDKHDMWLPFCHVAFEATDKA
jgi:hypothetical protein